MQLGSVGECRRAKEFARRLRRDGFDELVFSVVRSDRHELLVELDEEELAFAGNAVVEAPVVQSERELTGRRIDDTAPALRKHDIDSIASSRLQKHVPQLVVDDLARIEHGAAGIGRRELSRLDRRQLGILLRGEANLLHAPTRGRSCLEREPGRSNRKQQREGADRHEHATRADSARGQRGHLTVAIEAGQCKHDTQEQGDRRQQGQITQRREPEDPKHCFAR